MLQVKNQSSLLAMPAELRVFTLKNCVAASPYNRYAGGSFYSTSTKTWDYTEDGTIRVSDHWNFYSRGQQHCITDVDNSKLISKWVVAKYNAATEMYNVISVDEKDLTSLSERQKRNDNKNFTDILDQIKKRIQLRQAARIRRIEIRRAKQRAEKRLEDIKAGFLFYKGHVIDYGRRRGGWYWSESSSVKGEIHNESSCRTNGRKVNAYKEIDVRDFIKEISTIKKDVTRVLMMTEADFIFYKNCVKPEIISAIELADSFGMRNTLFMNLKKQTTAL